jgi:endonuclease YncB( thermonuclease family)
MRVPSARRPPNLCQDRLVLRVIALSLLLAALVPAAAVETEEGGFREPDFEGPFRVEMDRVIDGWRYNLRWREGPSSRREGRFHLADVHTPSATATFGAGDCERPLGIEVRDFVRRFVRGKQLRAREVRPGRDRRVMVGRLDVGGEDLSTVLLEAGYAIPYHDSWRNPALRRWDCEALNPTFGRPRAAEGADGAEAAD